MLLVENMKKYASPKEAYKNIISKLDIAGGDIYTAFSNTGYWNKSDVMETEFFITDGHAIITTGIKLYENNGNIISYAEACDIYERDIKYN